jgi:hypothetical protein
MKTKIVIIISILVIVGGFSFWFFGNSENIVPEAPVFHDESLQEVEIDRGEKANVLVNKTYGYSIEYPTNWAFYINDKRRITFADPANDFPSPHFSVTVGTTSASEAVELKGHLEYVRYESDDTIGQYSAIVTHRAGDIEDFPKEKILYVVKNSLVYEIEVDYMGPEAVWKSFKFIE